MNTASSIAALTACVISGFCLAAHAGPYVTAGLGQSDFNETNITDETGKSLSAGYQFRHVAIEGGYVDFGKADSSSLALSAELSGFEVAAIGRLRYGKASVYGKLGLWNWEFDVNGSNRHATDTVHGIGVDYAINRRLGLRGEYTEYGVEDSAANLGMLKVVYHW